RQARVDDVFDDNDVAALERRIEVLEQADLARAFSGRPVTRHRDEIERDGARGNGAREIRQEDERALEDRDEVQGGALRVGGVDLGSQGLDARVNLFCGK